MSPDLRVWGQSNILLEMEAETFNPEGLHLEADMDFKRIHEPPPNLPSIVQKMSYLCIHATFLKLSTIDIGAR